MKDKSKEVKEERYKIYISSLGRKDKYVGRSNEGRGYPVVYFRKSKFATDEEFKVILNYILGSL